MRILKYEMDWWTRQIQQIKFLIFVGPKTKYTSYLQMNFFKVIVSNNLNFDMYLHVKGSILVESIS